MANQWHYMQNQFLNETRDNYKKAFKLSKEHDNRLKKRMDDNPADTDYPIAYNRYHTLHVQFNTDYNAWIAQGGTQKGKTLNVDQLLALLPGKVNKWDIAVQAVYDKGTPRYVEIFPNDHKPFYTGGKDERIEAVQALSTAIGSDAGLATVKTSVDSAFTDLNNARNTQSGSKSTTSTASGAVETSRIKAMKGQYQNTGFFINKFPENPEMIEPLFDIHTLTNPDQTVFKGHLDPEENHPTLIHTFEASDLLRIKSNGNANIIAYLASTPGGIDSTPITITANHELLITASDFGVADFSVNRYLTIVNVSATNDTRFLVELY